MKDKQQVAVRVDSGFSLIEVLVALLILSVGLLGLAGLQSRGLRESNDALRRSQAVQSAEDILDRMRANRANADQYAIALGGSASGTGIVLTDLTEWKSGLANSLPGGDGSVTVNGNLVTVIVVWLDGHPVDNPDDNIITVVTRL